MRKTKGALFGVGALASGVTGGLATFCCVGPIALTSLGAATGGFAAVLTPYRPAFLAITLVLSAAALRGIYKTDRGSCETDCVSRRQTRRIRLLVWAVVILSIALATSSYWTSLLVYLTL